MSCPNNHPETDIQVRDGKRVCKSCRAKYTNENNKRRVKAIHNNKNARLRRKGSKNNQAAQTRIQLRANTRDTSQARATSQEKNNDRDDRNQ